MKQIKSFLILLLSNYCIFFSLHLFGHGFDGNTLVYVQHNGKTYLPIKQLCHDALRKKKWVLSVDQNSNCYYESRVQSVGKSISPYYMTINVDNDTHYDILCTPQQEFYVLGLNQWVPVCQLKIGDKVSSLFNEYKTITKIQFFNQPLKVYNLHVKKTHTFFVGRHSILTHNMLLPALSAGLVIPFGAGATAGSTAGGFFGPITFVGGFLIGGLVSCCIKAIVGNKIPHYEIECATPFEPLSNYINGESNKENKKFLLTNQASTSGGSPDPEDPDGKKRRKKIFNREINKVPEKITTKMTVEAANRIGFVKTNFYSQGQVIFKKGNKYITIDNASHNGGFWKMADSVENLAHKITRMGTYDQFLNRIGD